MSSPKRLLDASSRKLVVGKSVRTYPSSSAAGSVATEGVFPPRVSAAPPPVVGSARRVFESDLGGADGQAVF